MPICPTIKDARITVALIFPTSALTSMKGALNAGPSYLDPSTIAASAGSGRTEQKFPTIGLLQTSPSPVAKRVMVSPGIAGLSSVIGAPATLAQHNTVLVAVSCNSAGKLTGLRAVVLVEMVMPLPSGPGTFATNRILKSDALAEAVTGELGSALIRV